MSKVPLKGAMPRLLTLGVAIPATDLTINIVSFERVKVMVAIALMHPHELAPAPDLHLWSPTHTLVTGYMDWLLANNCVCYNLQFEHYISKI